MTIPAALEEFSMAEVARRDELSGFLPPVNEATARGEREIAADDGAQPVSWIPAPTSRAMSKKANIADSL